MKILIVEDHPSYREQLAEIIKRHLVGIEIIEAGDWEEAEQRFEKHVRTLTMVFMDGRLGGRFTGDLVERFRSRFSTGQIIGLTADPGSYAQPLWTAGCDKVLAKGDFDGLLLVLDGIRASVKSE